MFFFIIIIKKKGKEKEDDALTVPWSEISLHCNCKKKMFFIIIINYPYL